MPIEDWAIWDTNDNDRKNFKGNTFFSGYLPACHPAKSCHHESLRKKGLLKDIRACIKKLEQFPECDQWDPLIGAQNVKRIPEKGPYRFGVYKPYGKPWECRRVKSRELIGSKFILYCDCQKKNGLQDDCRRTQCKGKPWCMVTPLPQCPPSSHIPKIYIAPDPYEICPNKPWLKSPQYRDYQDMVKRSQYRRDEGCVDDPKLLATCY